MPTHHSSLVKAHWGGRWPSGEMADARDLKSRSGRISWRFNQLQVIFEKRLEFVLISGSKLGEIVGRIGREVGRLGRYNPW
jgi:hypothetical protein